MKVDDLVRYTPYEGADPEYGTVTEVRGKYIFVRFFGKESAVACDPATLEVE